jgi:hypothetical protein
MTQQEQHEFQPHLINKPPRTTISVFTAAAADTIDTTTAFVAAVAAAAAFAAAVAAAAAFAAAVAAAAAFAAAFAAAAAAALATFAATAAATFATAAAALATFATTAAAASATATAATATAVAPAAFAACVIATATTAADDKVVEIILFCALFIIRLPCVHVGIRWFVKPTPPTFMKRKRYVFLLFQLMRRHVVLPKIIIVELRHYIPFNLLFSCHLYLPRRNIYSPPPHRPAKA